MTLISKNIQALRKRMGWTQAVFAEKIGVKRSLVGAYEESRSDPRLSNLIVISRLFDLSVDDLISVNLHTVSEEKLESYFIKNKKQAERKSSIANDQVKVLTVSVTEGEENIELVPQKASAGYSAGYCDPEFIEELPRFRLPMLPNNGTYRAFEITGDSMLPLESGTIVVGQYVSDYKSLKNGKTYVLVTKNDGVVYKRVFNYIEERGKLFLVSDNTLYSPYELGLMDLLEIWEAKAFISVKFPEVANDLSNFGKSEPTESINLDELTKLVLELKTDIVKLKSEKN